MAPTRVPTDLVSRYLSPSVLGQSPPPPAKEACGVRTVEADGGSIAGVNARTGDNLWSIFLGNEVDAHDMVGKVCVWEEAVGDSAGVESH